MARLFAPLRANTATLNFIPILNSTRHFSQPISCIMSEDEDVHYDHTHRALLQAFLARSILNFDEAKPLLAAILSAQGEPSPLQSLHSTHNSHST